MKLGLSSFSAGWAVGPAGREAGRQLDFIGLIELTHFYRLHLLQIGDNLPLGALPRAQLERARELLAAYQIELQLGARGLTQEEVCAHLELAKFFGATLIRMVIDKGAYQPPEEEIVRLLRALAPRLQEQGVVLALENHDHFTARALARMVRQAQSRYIGVCLDTANSLGAGEGLGEVARQLLPHTVNLHIKDFAVSRVEGGMGFNVEGRPAGQGMAGVETLLRRLRRQDSRLGCILELWAPPADTPAETLAREARQIGESVNYLRDLVERPPQEIPFGASAAYTISRAGPHFTVKDICASIRELGAAGFTHYQPEISFVPALGEWEAGGAAQVNVASGRAGVRVRQLTAHFCMAFFCDDRVILEDTGLPEMRRFVDIAGQIDGCSQVLIPIGPLRFAGQQTPQHLCEVEAAFWGKLQKMARMAERAGLDVAFELLPQNYVGGYQALFERGERHGLPAFGVNLDTSHALANGEAVEGLPARFPGRIWGTHLGDSAGKPGEKLVPGRGVLGWERLIPALLRHCGPESLDLEIVAPPGEAESQYREGRRFLRRCLERCAATARA